VLSLVLQGFRTEEIAERLYISPGTAKTHIAKIHRKVETSSRPALLAKAMQTR
jgi:DNA-binding CsgD family transcriptional regulator